MLDFFTENLWIAWLIVAAVMLIIEINTAALVSIWFVFSAILTAVISLFIENIISQVIIFFALSALFLVIFNKIYRKKGKIQSDNDVEYTPVGKLAVAENIITKTDGKVCLGDVYWKAVCDKNEIQAGTKVKVVSVNGTTLTVEEL